MIIICVSVLAILVFAIVGYNYVLYYKYNKTTINSQGQFETVTIPIPKTGSVILFR